MNQKRNEGDTSELLTIAFEKVNLAAAYYSKGELDLSLQAYKETTIFLRHIISKTEDKSDLFRLNKMYNIYNKRIREISKSVSYSNNLKQDQARFSLKLPSKEYCMTKELPIILHNEFKNIEQSNTVPDKHAFINQLDMTSTPLSWETKVNGSTGTMRSKMKDTINKRIKSLDASNIMNLKKIMYEPKRYEVLGDHKREEVFKQRDDIKNQIDLIDENHKELNYDEKQKQRKGPVWPLSNDSPKSFVIKRSPFTKRLVVKKRDRHDTNTTDTEDLTLFLENPYKSLDDMSQSHNIFLLIHRIHKCLTCGGYLTDKLHLPIDIWYQSSIRLSSLNIKIKNCNDISAILENSKNFDIMSSMIRIEKAFQEVNGALITVDHSELRKKRNKNFGHKKEHQSDNGKASQNIALWGSEITRYIRRINPSNMKTYLNALTRLFKAAKVFEGWHEIVSSDNEKQMLDYCLKLFSNIFCNFVIKDCLILLDEWIRSGKNCIME